VDQSATEVLVDARGLLCPVPIIRLSKAIKGVSVGGLVRLLATDPGSDPDVRAWEKQTGNELVSTAHQGKEFSFLLRRKK
jgi:tRNA 2-thiouridine synthesizing protein A